MSPVPLSPSPDGGKTLTFFNNDYRGEFQTVTFEGPEIKKLFYGNFHKVRLSPGNVLRYSHGPLSVSHKRCV